MKNEKTGPFKLFPLSPVSPVSSVCLTEVFWENMKK